MNTLKYILSLVFVFLIQLSILETESFSFSKESECVIDYKGAFKNSEQVYAKLFHSIENDKLASISCSSLFILGFSSRENADLVDAWKKLFKEGDAISDILRKDKNVLKWVSKQGNIPQNSLDDLITNLDSKTAEKARAFLDN